MQNWIKRLHRAEDALLVALLTSLILLATTQILLRNIFDTGLIWADPLLRVLVLWLGLVGATVATRENRHVCIDLLSQLDTKRSHLLIQSFVGQICAWTCLVVAWHGSRWVLMDYEDGLSAFAGLPAWLLESIIPLAFALIGLRYLMMSVGWFKLYWQGWKPSAKPKT